MERLTYWTSCGNSGDTVVIDQLSFEDCMKVQESLKRLAAYEDTGLTPEEIMDGRMLTGWIPVEERLPDQNMEVYASLECCNGVQEVREAYYRDGDFMSSQGCSLHKIIKAWQPRWVPMPYDPQS